jgi:hypothetical protein
MNVREELEALVTKIGEERALNIIKNSAVDIETDKTLTIIANLGSHHLPDTFRRGFVHIASKGNLDFSSPDRVREQYRDILTRLSSLLKSKVWSRIYLVPFGHSTLSMQIKLLVYRITRIETVDLFYDGKGGYSDLDIQLRPIIVAADEHAGNVEHVRDRSESPAGGD